MVMGEEDGDGRGRWWWERKRGEGREARAHDARKNATRSREHVTSSSLRARLHLHSSSVFSFVGCLTRAARVAYHSPPLLLTESPARVFLNNTHNSPRLEAADRVVCVTGWPPSCMP
jgi:hypothetical protein